MAVIVSEWSAARTDWRGARIVAERDSLVAVHTETLGQAVDLDDPALYINRDLGRPRFILQVLEEAVGEQHPLL